MSQTLNFQIQIQAPVATVRDIMLNHPTYEQRTSAFAPWSTYQWSRDLDSEIIFLGSDGVGGMIGKIAQHRLYEYVSICHQAEIVVDEQTGQTTVKAHPQQAYENYSFSTLADWSTQLDVECTEMPDEYLDMFRQMWPQALNLLKWLCEK